MQNDCSKKKTIKLKEALKIVSVMLGWQFYMQGLKKRNDILDFDISKYSLEDLIKANRLVSSNNSRKQKMASYWRSRTGKDYPCTIQTVCADRLIAAIYTLMNFPADGEMIAVIGNKGVGCVVPDYSQLS